MKNLFKSLIIVTVLCPLSTQNALAFVDPPGLKYPTDKKCYSEYRVNKYRDKPIKKFTQKRLFDDLGRDDMHQYQDRWSDLIIGTRRIAVRKHIIEQCKNKKSGRPFEKRCPYDLPQFSSDAALTMFQTKFNTSPHEDDFWLRTDDLEDENDLVDSEFKALEQPLIEACGTNKWGYGSQ